ncbi:MAG: carbohydrate kinase [Chitinophagaceae bacterium]|nr:carbohydrate kinase [Chitinophagaceae bacterium]
MKILCVGEALIDMFCTERCASLSAGEHFIKKAGGAPTNVAAAIASLGGEVDLAAKVGADPFGRQLIQVMKEFGVSTKWMWQDEQHFTTMAYVSLNEQGERDFVFHRGADRELTCKEVEAIQLEEYGIVHFGSATAFLEGPLREAYQSLMNRALRQDVFISFDPNYRDALFGNNQPSFIEQSLNFLANASFFKVSEEEALLITGKATLEDAADYFRNKSKAVFAITMGSAGTLLGFHNNNITIPSLEVKCVDTTGAGDAFVGAVLYQLSRFSQGKSRDLSIEEWKSIVQKANKAGARTCESMGAMEAFRRLSSELLN